MLYRAALESGYVQVLKRFKEGILIGYFILLISQNFILHFKDFTFFEKRKNTFDDFGVLMLNANSYLSNLLVSFYSS